MTIAQTDGFGVYEDNYERIEEEESPTEPADDNPLNKLQNSL